MPTYSLTVDFAPQDLSTLWQAQEKLVMVKQTGDSSTSVAWVSFKPFQNNQITWSEEYALYSSQSSIENGASIQKLSDIEAKDRFRYPFENGIFNTPTLQPELKPDHYQVTNNISDYPSLVFGVAQSVQVNGSPNPYKPLCATLVPKFQTADFEPLDIIEVYMDAKVKDGMVVTDVFSEKIVLTFDGENPNQRIMYKDGKFVVVQN